MNTKLAVRVSLIKEYLMSICDMYAYISFNRNCD